MLEQIIYTNDNVTSEKLQRVRKSYLHNNDKIFTTTNRHSKRHHKEIQRKIHRWRQLITGYVFMPVGVSGDLRAQFVDSADFWPPHLGCLASSQSALCPNYARRSPLTPTGIKTYPVINCRHRCIFRCISLWCRFEWRFVVVNILSLLCK